MSQVRKGQNGWLLWHLVANSTDLLPDLTYYLLPKVRSQEHL